MMLVLSKSEMITRDDWLKANGYGVKQAVADLEEDCCGSRSFHYEIHPSNLCDSVYVCYKGKRHLITDLDNL